MLPDVMVRKFENNGLVQKVKVNGERNILWML